MSSVDHGSDPQSDGLCVLSIDLGTSGPKVGLISADGRVLDWTFEPTPLMLLPGGGAEQRPDDWWNAIVTCTHRLLERRLVSPECIGAVCCTAQWSGTVPVDRDGEPLMNAIIWLDTRGAQYIPSIVGGLPSIEGYRPDKLITWIRLTGTVPTRSGKDSIAHILFIKHERPDVYRRTDKFLEPKDYINLRLTGRAAASFDSIGLHCLTDNRDIRRIAYEPRLFAMSGLDPAQFPALLPSTAVLGTLSARAAAELGLTEGTQVVAGSPDVQATAIGSGAVLDYQAHLYLGTSSWLSCHVPFKRADVFHNMGSLPSGVTGRWLVLNEQECAGSCLNYFLDSMLYTHDQFPICDKPAEAYSLLNQDAQQSPAGSNGLIFTPWLYGERSPVDDAAVRGGFLNLSLTTSRPDMARAVLEGVAYNSRWLLTYTEKLAGRRLDNIAMVGGGAISDLWCQIHADVLNRTVRQVKDPRLAPLRGAAFQALVALGRMSFGDVPDCVEIARTYRPDPVHRKLYDKLFGAFVQMYHRLKPVYARLNAQG